MMVLGRTKEYHRGRWEMKNTHITNNTNEQPNNINKHKEIGTMLQGSGLVPSNGYMSLLIEQWHHLRAILWRHRFYMWLKLRVNPDWWTFMICIIYSAHLRSNYPPLSPHHLRRGIPKEEWPMTGERGDPRERIIVLPWHLVSGGLKRVTRGRVNEIR